MLCVRAYHDNSSEECQGNSHLHFERITIFNNVSHIIRHGCSSIGFTIHFSMAVITTYAVQGPVNSVAYHKLNNSKGTYEKERGGKKGEGVRQGETEYTCRVYLPTERCLEVPNME